ncbi:MAG: hypothetical protein M1833_004539 [Piccolia ochrophora]|nr:MAG: hypothetical protein M1833_004539 [Piccolia ochrophora]
MMGELIKRMAVDPARFSEDPIDYSVLAASTAVAWILVLELHCIIFAKFRLRKGLYFWSCLVTSWGIALHALAILLKYFVGIHWVLGDVMLSTGWVMMVTGQSVILYSRLHLITRKRAILRFVLGMILVNAVALHVPVIVFLFGADAPSGVSWGFRFHAMEQAQLVLFSVQETTIAAIYVWITLRLLKSISHKKTRSVMFQLVSINVACVGMDIILIVLMFTNQYFAEASIKPMLYAIKLKFEFLVLNQLMDLITEGLASNNTKHTWPGGPRHRRDPLHWALEKDNSDLEDAPAPGQAPRAGVKGRGGSDDKPSSVPKTTSWGWSRRATDVEQANAIEQPRKVAVRTDIEVERDTPDIWNDPSAHPPTDPPSKDVDDPLTFLFPRDQTVKV